MIIIQNEYMKLEDSLSKTIKDSELTTVSKDLIEIGIDAWIENETLKDIPIIGTLTSLIKTSQSVSNYFFLKKIISFISGIKDVSRQEREELIDKIDGDKRYRLKVGEQLLYIIQSCEDHLVTSYLSQIFTAFLKKKIDYSQFLKSSSIIHRMSTYEIELFIDKKEEFERIGSGEETPNEEDFTFIRLGLLGFSTEPIRVEENGDWKNDQKFTTKGGNVSIWTTQTGKIFWDYLSKIED